MNSKKNSIGFIQAIYIAHAAGSPMFKVDHVEAREGRGLEGDRYALKTGFWQMLSNPREVIRDVSFINASDVENSGFTESETRRNIIVQTNLKLTQLIGKQFLVGEVLFKGIEECTPCKRPSELSGKESFAQIFKNKGGLRAQVLSSGRIKNRDSIILVDDQS